MLRWQADLELMWRYSDVLIGTCCDMQAPLVYSDRNFEPMVDHLDLSSALG